MQHLRVEHRNDASRSTGEGGFVLLATLFLILMLSAGAVFFVNAARDEQMMGRSMRESGRAFYAAEAGVNYMVGTWAALEYDTATASPGDSIDLGWTDLDYGARFHALLRRTDGGTGRRMYSLRIIGEGTRRDGGRSVRTMDLMATPWDLDIRSAVEGGSERFEAADGALVSGLDLNPPGWDPLCDVLEDRPGVVWPDPDSTDVRDAADVIGAPPIDIDLTNTATNVFDWGDQDIDDLIALANITIPSPNAVAGQIKPHLTGGATCWTEPWKNWGDPENPSAPCGDYFPIIHRAGDLTIRNGQGVGQGVLIVDGDLHIEDDFEFYGLVIVRGELTMQDIAKIHGAVITSEGVLLDSGDPEIQYSSCVVERAILGAGLYSVHPVGGRAWHQSR